MNNSIKKILVIITIRHISFQQTESGKFGGRANSFLFKKIC